MGADVIGSYDICPVCRWEDDLTAFKDPHAPGGGPNADGLAQARRNFDLCGANNERERIDCRPPLPEELPRFDWSIFEHFARIRDSFDMAVWVFNKANGQTSFPCGAWKSKKDAEVWVRDVGASGVLSKYIVGESAWDSNVRRGQLKAENPERSTSEFKRNYTTAIDHAHYEDGKPA